MKNLSMPATLVAAVILVPAIAQPQAQEKYTIKFKELNQGESSRVESKETMTMKTTTTIEKQKEPAAQEFKGSKHYLFTQTVLERPQGAALPTKVQRTYDKALHEGSEPLVKSPGPLPMNGKTILIEKKGDKYEFRLQDGKLLDTGISDLQDEFDRDEGAKTKKALIPPGPVALNETWKFDPKDFGGPSGKDKESTKMLKSEGAAKLTKVYKKDGRQFGVIEAVMELQMVVTIKGGAGGPPSDMTSESKVLFKLTYDGCIDGTLNEGKLSGTGNINSKSSFKVEQGGAPINVSTVGNALATVENVWQELTKK